MKYLLKLAHPHLIYSVSIKNLIYFNLQRKKYIKCVRQYIIFQTSFRWMSAKTFEESFNIENLIKPPIFFSD